MENIMDISIIIPIYNAGSIIRRAVDEIVRVMSPLGVDYEVLLRDDGSVDESKKILNEVLSEHSQIVKCYGNLSNEGLGATLRKLFSDAQGKKIVYCDCDLPFGARVIPALVNELETQDIVVASRYRGAVNKTSFARKACSRLYYFLCKILFGIPVSDIGSGSVGIRKEVLSQIELDARKFDIHAELYSKAFKKGLKIKEIPVDSNGNREGSFYIWAHGPDTLIRTFKLYFGLLGKT